MYTYGYIHIHMYIYIYTYVHPGANEAFAPDAQRWSAVAWIKTWRLGPKNRRTEMLVSSLRKARNPRPSNDVSTRF